MLPEITLQRINWAMTLLTELPEIHQQKPPLSNNNLTSVLAWEMAEGGGFGNEAVNNPLNTTETFPGSWNVVPTGDGRYVQGYPTESDGIQATINTLTNGFYDDILNDLVNSTTPLNTVTDIGHSEWGTLLFGLLGTLPEAQTAINEYLANKSWGDMFIKFRNGELYEKIVVNGQSELHQLPANLVETVPAYMIIPDNANGGWENRYAGKIVPAAAP